MIAPAVETALTDALEAADLAEGLEDFIAETAAEMPEEFAVKLRALAEECRELERDRMAEARQLERMQ